MPIALTGGVFYLLMALTVWRMGRRTPLSGVVRLWTLGGLSASACLLLVAGRSMLPVAVGYGLSTVLGAVSMLLQLGALRQLLARPQVWQPLAWAVALALALMLAVGWIGNRLWIFVAGCLVLAALSGMLAWHARLTALKLRSRSAGLMAWSQTALALSFVVRGLGVAAGLAPYQPGVGGPAFAVHHVVVVLAALYGSLGFMGLLLDITRRGEARARENQVAEAARREDAELKAQELRVLLQQRDALATERERMLQMLAHEIRQPLHNASGALQAAGQALRLQPEAGAGQQTGLVAQRLGRAEAVLGEVRAVLDNTLAAASLLSRRAPLAVQEVDLDFLIDLALGDLDETQRKQVQLQWHTDLRQVEVEPGLLRLALRNLLVNAFSHGGPGVAVQLRVSERDAPPALLLAVVDDGPGLPLAALPPERRPGLGLGIVQQVVALHGGRLELLPNQPTGLQAVLVLPQLVA
jgi:signal transduction histidine kinase